MGDLVLVSGFYHRAPVVQVLGRAYWAPAVASEKITDIQVSQRRGGERGGEGIGEEGRAGKRRRGDERR